MYVLYVRKVKIGPYFNTNWKGVKGMIMLVTRDGWSMYCVVHLQQGMQRTRRILFVTIKSKIKGQTVSVAFRYKK